MTDKIDWENAPEGATHYAIENNHVTWLSMGGDSLWRVLHKKRWILASGLPRGVVKIPKRITQAVFNGLPVEYRWAAVDEDGETYAHAVKPECHFYSGRWVQPIIRGSLALFGGDHDATDWHNSLIERLDVPTADKPESITDVARSIEAARIEERDAVNNPKHYTSHASGVECIQITEHMSFNLGNAVKYIWRCDLKHDAPIQDLEKAIWYIEREIKRRGGAA